MPVIPGIPRLTFASGERFTPIGALRAVGLSRRDEVTYALLMGVSGAAFRVAWSPDWALDMGGFAPEDLVAYGAEWLGLRAEPRLNDAVEDAWDRVRASIDTGLPTLTCGLAGAPEFAVIAGYEENPRRFHVRGYFEKEDSAGYSLVDLRPWQGWNHLGFGSSPLVLLSPGPPPDRGRLLLRALARAQHLSKVGRVETKGRIHFFGRAAYDAWIDSLRNLDTSGDLGMKAWAMAANLSAIADARRAAAEFLRIVGAMRPEWHAALTRASEHYLHLLSVLAKAQPIIDFPRDEPARAAELAAEMLADPHRREILAKFLWTAKAEDDEALGWIDFVLNEL